MKNIYLVKKFTLCFCFSFLFISLSPFAYAQKEFTKRINNLHIKGDYILFGNTNMTLLNYATSTNNSLNQMIYVDIDNDASTLNSSKSKAYFSTENGAIPSCSKIKFAGLYWIGRAHDYANPSQSPNTFTVTKNGTTYNLNKRKVLLKGPRASTYTEFTANAEDILYPSYENDNLYTGFVDITNYVIAQTQDKITSDGDYYTVANIALREGNGGSVGYCGAWAIIIVYENSKMNWRDIAVFDGYKYMNAENSPKDLEIDGFKTSSKGNVNMKMGLLACEGDVGITGDYFYLLYNGNNTYPLKHSLNSTNNFFNSSIYTGKPFSVNDTDRDPNLKNNTGIDICMFNIYNPGNTYIKNNQTSATFRYGSSQDVYSISLIAMSVDAYVPEIDGSNLVTQLNGVNVTNTSPLTIEPGQPIGYTLDLQNSGTENILDSKIYIPLSSVTQNIKILKYEDGYPEPIIIPGGANVSIPGDPTAGYAKIPAPYGYIEWNIGEFKVGSHAQLKYSVESTTNCFSLRNPGCNPDGLNITTQAIIRGKGKTSETYITDGISNFGYTQGICKDPIWEKQKVNITNVDAFVAAHCGLPENKNLCPGVPEAKTEFKFAGRPTDSPIGTTYSWKNDNTAIGLVASGNGDLPAFTPINNGTTVLTANITVYPTKNGCTGNSITFKIDVNPAPKPTAPDITSCPHRGVITFAAIATPGYELQWYDAASGGSPLSNAPTANTEVLTPTTYTKYVSLKMTTPPYCEGPRVAVRVIVQDTEKPVITKCPPAYSAVGCNENDVSANLPYSANPKSVEKTVFENVAGGRATDNCDIIDWSYQDTKQVNPTNIVINRTWTIKDWVGNSTSCVQKITITNATPPTITCPSNITETITDANSNCTKLILTPKPVVQQDYKCDWTISWVMTGATASSSAITGQNHVDEHTFNIGVTKITYTVTNSFGASASCSFTVTVLDGTTLSITKCPPPITKSGCSVNDLTKHDLPEYKTTETEVTQTLFEGQLGTTSKICGTVYYYYQDALDNTSCPVTIKRTWKVTDKVSRTATCVQVIQLNDIVSPYFKSCPKPITQNLTGTASTLAITIGDPQATDDGCGIKSLTWEIVYPTGHVPDKATGTGVIGSHNFPAGTSTVTYTTLDMCNNPATCTFTVTVSDITPPNITTCPPNKTLEGCSTADLLTSTIVTPAPAPATKLGYSGSTVIVTKAQFEAEGGTATDNVGVVEYAYSDAKETTICPITVNRTWTVKDASGKTATCKQVFTIEDKTNPTLTWTQANVTEDAGSNCKKRVNIAPAIPNDNCIANPLTLTWQITDNNGVVLDQSPSTGTNTINEYEFPIGKSTFTYTLTDACNNSITKSFTIDIQDHTPPVITTCPEDRDITGCNTDALLAKLSLAYNETGTTVTSTQFSNAGGVASDNCAIKTYAYKDSKTGVCPIIVKRTWTVEDKYGNKNAIACVQTITIKDNTAPVLSCPPAPAPISITDNSNSIIVNTPNPTVIEDCTENPVTLTWEIKFPTGHVPPTETGTGNIGNHEFPIGTSTITYTAKNVCNLSSTPCSFEIKVIDNSNPTITKCPPAQSIEGCDENAIGAKWPTLPFSLVKKTVTENDFTTIAGGSASDNNGITEYIYHDVITSAANECPMKVTRTWTVKDAQGNATTCEQEIEIKDSTNPTIAQLANITQNLLADCKATIITTNPTYNDNCKVASLSYIITGALTDQSATTGIHFVGKKDFPVGTSTITYTVTDVCGNTASMHFDVTVIDNIPPKVSCPINKTIEGCDEKAIVPAYKTTETTITTTEFTNLGGTADDNCGIKSITYKDAITQASCPTKVERTWTVTDNNNQRVSCVQTITIEDQKAPEILQLADIKEDVVSGCAKNITPPNPVPTDNCGIKWLSFEMTGATTYKSPLNGTYYVGARSFNVGVTTITYTATDKCGNKTSMSFKVEVVDNIKPIIKADDKTFKGCSIADITGIPAYSDTKATVPFTDITDLNKYLSYIEENCKLIECSYIDTKTDGCPITIKRVWTVLDVYKNEGTVEQTIKIEDDVLPTIKCPSDITKNITAGCELEIDTPNPSFDDNCGKDKVTLTWTIKNDKGVEVAHSAPTGQNFVGKYTFGVGKWDITYSATDKCHPTQPVSCTFNITVQDDQKPVIDNCPPAKTIEGCSTAAVTNPVYNENKTEVSEDVFKANGGKATDNCDNLKYYYQDVQSGPCPISVTRTWTVTDKGNNSVICQQLITIKDTQKPTITCKTVPEQFITTGCEANVDNPQPEYGDNCGAVKTIYYKITYPAGHKPQEYESPKTGLNFVGSRAFPIGESTIEYTVVDKCDNIQTCSYIVKVTDNKPPVINCNNASIIVKTDPGKCYATNVTLPKPWAEDQCKTSEVTLTNNAPAQYPKGINTVTWTAKDPSGNTATCDVTVTVVDEESPVIKTCPPNTEVSGCDENTTNLIPAFSANGAVDADGFLSVGGKAEDNCAVVKWIYSDTKKDNCPVVVHRIWKVEDAAGHQSAACEQLITIKNFTIPAAPATGMKDIFCESEATPPTLPVINDGCGRIITNISDPVITKNLTNNCSGTIVYTYTYTDCSGNKLDWKHVYTLKAHDFVLPKDKEETVNCISDEKQTTPPEVRDYCGRLITPEFVGRTTDPADPKCGGTVTYTWKYTECHGQHTNNWRQIITIANSLPPTAIAPEPVTVECKDDPIFKNPQSHAGDLKDAKGACGDQINDIVVTDAPGTGKGCKDDPYVVIRTFTIKDCFGKTANFTQKIQAIDTKAPVFQNCITGTQVNNDTGKDYATLNFPTVPTATDNCGNANLSVIASYTGPVTLPPNYFDFITTTNLNGQYKIGVTTIKFTATDACGNESVCQFNVIVNDIEAPQPPKCPQQTVPIQCLESVPAPFATYAEWKAAGGTIIDNLAVDENYLRLVSNVTTPSSTGCGYTVTRTYEIQDISPQHLKAYCDHVLTVKDVTPPTVPTTKLPDRTETGCSKDEFPAVKTIAELATLAGGPITDNCAGELKLEVKDDVSGSCPIVINRTYTVSDACDNKATITQKITIEAKQPKLSKPSLDDEPYDNICKIEDVNDGVTNINELLTKYGLTLTDYCGDISTLKFEITTNKTSAADACPVVYKRTYKITGKCNKFVEISKNILLNDKISPVVESGALKDVTLNKCHDYVVPVAKTKEDLVNLGVVVKDNCTPDDKLKITYTDTPISDDGKCKKVFKRAYSITDLCNNTPLVVEYTITLQDQDAPVIKGIIPPSTIEGCKKEDAPAAVSTAADLLGIMVSESPSVGKSISDNCTALNDLTVTSNDNATGECSITLTRTYTVTDNCGLKSTISQVITIKDTKAPVIKDKTTGADLLSKDEHFDGCDETKKPAELKTIAEMETAFGVNIKDVCPADGVISIVSVTESVESKECPLHIKRVYTLEDKCHNKTTFTHNIYIEDKTAPSVSAQTKTPELLGCDVNVLPPNQYTIADLESIFGFTISDNCTDKNKLTYTATTPDVVVPGCPIKVTRHGEIADKCGNKSSITLSYEIKDADAPKLIKDKSIPLGQTDMNACIAAAPTGPDEATIKALYEDCNAFTVKKSGTPTGDDCSWTATYTYDIEDACHNKVTPSPSITYTGGDKEGPQFTPPADIIDHPTDAGKDYATLTINVPAVTDNCTAVADIKLVNNKTNTSDASGQYKIGTTIVEYTATDKCGKETKHSFSVTVKDTEKPDPGCVVGSTFDRNTDPDEDFYTIKGTEFDAKPTDNSGKFTVTNNLNNSSSVAGIKLSIDSHTIKWTVKDESGNEATCETIVNVIDNQPPHIECKSGSPFTRNVNADKPTYKVQGKEFDPEKFGDNVAGYTIKHNFAGAPSATTLANAELPIGTTTITWTVTDAAGKASATCKTIVEVKDIEKPTWVKCLSGSNQKHDTDPDKITYTVPDNSWDAEGKDNSNKLLSLTVELTGATTLTLNGTPYSAGPPEVAYVPATLNGVAFNKGETTVKWTVKDLSGNTETCIYTVTIQDNQKPVITCAVTGNQTITLAAGSKTYTHNGTSWDATATDNDGTTPVMTYTLKDDKSGNVIGTGNSLNGVVFNIGEYTITWVATDQAGNTSTNPCEFKLIVKDDEKPTPSANCNNGGHFDRNMDNGKKTYTIKATDNWDVVFTDNDKVTTQGVTLSGATTTATTLSTLVGVVLNKGTTTIKWDAMDASGNTSTCQFTVTVTDNQPPVISVCENNITLHEANTDDGVNTYTVKATDNWDATVTDNDAMASFTAVLSGATTATISGTAYSAGPPPVAYVPATLAGTTFNIGTTQVKWTATDINGLVSECNFTVKVKDIENPKPDCPPTLDKIYYTDNGVSTYTIKTTDNIDISATDNNGILSISYELTGKTTGTATGTPSSPPSLVGIPFNMGITMVKWTFTDNSGNKAYCSYTVTVKDSETPKITNCVGQGLLSPASAPVDPATITDAMLITGGYVQTVNPDSHEKYYTQTTTAWDATATDNVNLVSMTYNLTGATTGSGNSLQNAKFTVGRTRVTWTAVDDSGNKSYCIFIVDVVDMEPPTLDCKGIGSQTKNTDEGKNTYTVPDNTWDATATDNVKLSSFGYTLTDPDGVVVTTTGTTLYNVSFKIGTSHVKWVARDSYGLEATCEYDITVVDNQPPKFTDCVNSPLGDRTVENTLGNTSYIHSGTGWDAHATDNDFVDVFNVELSGATTLTIVGNQTNPPSLNGVEFKSGLTTVLWTIKDKAGQTVTCSFTVRVIDTEPPKPDCGALVDQTKNADDGVSTYTHTDNSWNVTATDNDVIKSMEYVLSGATTGTGNTLNGVNFNVGLTHVLWVVTDNSDNTATCKFDVTVKDNQPPKLDCEAGSNKLVTTDPGLNVFIKSGTDWDAKVNENHLLKSLTYTLSGATKGTGSTLNGTVFKMGVTTVTWIATDVSGNVSLPCEYTVTVEDKEPPVITNCALITANPIITVVAEIGTNKYIKLGTDWDAIATDNDEVKSVIYTMTGATTGTGYTLNGVQFNIGETTITWIATDKSGNTSAPCTFIFRLEDKEPPKISNCKDGSNKDVDAEHDKTTYTVTDNTWDISATDNDAIKSIKYVLTGQTTGSGDNTLNGVTFNLGVTTVSWTVLDASDNSTTCTYTVTVHDRQKPDITNCLDQNNKQVHTDLDVNTYTHKDNTWDAKAKDNHILESLKYELSGATTGSATGDGVNTPTLNGIVFNMGLTTVKWTARDVTGNESYCIFTVNVSDIQPPKIDHCVDNDDKTEYSGFGTPTYIKHGTDWDATATDNDPPVKSVTYDLNGVTTGTGASLDGVAFNVGVTNVTWTAIDKSGNSSYCIFKVTIPEQAKLEIIKTANRPNVSAVGDTVKYSIAVKNLSNVPLHQIIVTDPLTKLQDTITSLAINEQKIINTMYLVKQEDLDAPNGLLTNIVRGIGTTPGGIDTETSHSVDVVIIQNPRLELDKTADKESVKTLGETINYTIKVQNTGNVTLTNVTITDPLTALNQTIAKFSPKEEKVFTTSYAVTQADLDRGFIENIVSGTAVNPNGTNSTATDIVRVKAIQLPSYKTTKESDKNLVKDVGEVINYTITVTNSGNVTLTNTEVKDPLTGLSQTIPSMKPGDVSSFVTSYTVTQGDIDKGYIKNVVVAKGNSPDPKVPPIEGDTTKIVYVAIVARPDTARTTVRVPVDIKVLANDTTYNRTLAMTITQQPIGGSVIINPDLTVTYIPLAGFYGTDNFIYQICTTNPTIPVSCDTAIVRINVIKLPIKPSVTEHYTMYVDDPPIQLSNLLDSITKIKGKLKMIYQPFHGTATVNDADSTIFYKPLPKYVGDDNLTYEVSVDNKCVIHNAVIHVLPRPVPTIIVHNVITPNGDGINDYLVIDSIEKYPVNKVTIFDRWGNTITVIENYDNKTQRWGGMYKDNRKVVDGVYYYKIELPDRKSILGWILVRSSRS